MKLKESNISKLKHLLKLLALQIGSPVSPSSLAENTELSKPTIYEYLDSLERLFIIYKLNPIDAKDYHSISRGFKVYFWDLGLRNYFAGNYIALNQSPDKGHLFENFVINQVKREIIYKKKKIDIGYFRNQNGAEVDFVMKKDNEELLYECKFGENRDKIYSKLFKTEIACIHENNWLELLDQ